MSNKLIVLMLDGVSADYLLTESGRLPHLSALSKRGFQIDRLHAEVCGTSLPGRVSMLTGAKADVSGVYGNKIWDGASFRYATPYDVRVPTIPGRAKAAGKTVAVMGFGMVRLEDADIYMPPWWVGTFIQRARDAAPIPSEQGWLKIIQHQNHHPHFVSTMQAAGLPVTLPQMPAATPGERFLFGIASDQAMFNWVGALAASQDGPDLIFAEVLVTDTLQHYSGYKSEQAHWSVQYVDSLVGLVVERLRLAGKVDEYNIAVMSDHGHSPIDQALRPEVIIPNATFCSEGSMLHVVPKDADELAQIEAALAPFGVTRYTSAHVPADFRKQVVTFAAPPRTSFEHEQENPERLPLMKPNAVSSHGLKPGEPGDDRFAIFAGPDVPPGKIGEADAVQIAPTFATLLGLGTSDFMAPPVFATAQA
jgi:predicted AlkP superfamily pyrophosphatase or phosphodiesterase